MGSYGRALKRQQQREKDRIDTIANLNSVSALVKMGVPYKTADKVMKGLTQAMDEELNIKLDVICQATEESLMVLERQVCQANIALFLRAVELTFGSLKTVQRGWSALLDNFNVAVAEAEQGGLESVTETIREHTGLDWDFDDVDLDKYREYWDGAACAVGILGREMKALQEEEKGMRLVDLDDLEGLGGKTMIRRVLDSYERDHPLKEMVLDNREWDIILERKDEDFKTILRRKETA